MTNIILSLSSSPWIFGTSLYNKLFNTYNHDYLYKAVKVRDKMTFEKILDLMIETEMFTGTSISMPFKIEATNYLDKKGIKILDIVTEDGDLEDVFVQLTKN